VMTRREVNAGYRRLIKQAGKEDCRQATISALAHRDLFFLLTRILHREDLNTDFHFARCREYQANPDGYVDLWFREGGKTSIITFGGTIQQIMNSPESTTGIISVTRPLAKKFLRQIKVELETNRALQEVAPDVFWRDPQRESPKWSEDEGIVVKRNGNPKEATIEAFGLIDGQPVGPHYHHLLYEDVVNKDTVRTPAMMQRVDEAFQESLNLGITGGTRNATGTRWHYNDLWGRVIERGTFRPRIWTATKDGTFTGEPWIWTREELAQKINDMGPYVAACQLFMDPKQESLQSFQDAWLRYWNADRFKGLNLYLLCDPASAKKPESDYTVFMVLGLGSDRNYYVVNWIRDRLSLTERANILFRWHQLYRPVGVGYEKYGMQSDIEHFQDRMERDNYRFGIVPLAGPLAKVSRIERLVPYFFGGRIYVPNSSPYTQYDGETIDLTRAFIRDEYLAHPFEVHDDMLDCMSRILDENLGATFPQGKATDPLNVSRPPEKEYDPLTWGLERS
jgi:predicted phage terminase large subunit-like protein